MSGSDETMLLRWQRAVALQGSVLATPSPPPQEDEPFGLRCLDCSLNGIIQYGNWRSYTRGNYEVVTSDCSITTNEDFDTLIPLNEEGLDTAVNKRGRTPWATPSPAETTARREHLHHPVTPLPPDCDLMHTSAPR